MQDRIKSGRASLKQNRLPIVKGFLKTKLNLTYGYKLDKQDVNSFLTEKEKLPIYGSETKTVFLGTSKLGALGLKMFSKNFLTALGNMCE